ncbi:hypothetical protein R5R35_013064 [Gryllus longicercus]
MYELILIPHLEPYLFREFINILIELLKKKELISPAELVIPWVPLYNLCKNILFSSRVSLGMYGYSLLIQKEFVALIQIARFYFEETATKEMLDEWKPMLCPFDYRTVSDTFQIMSYFLPVQFTSNREKEYTLWLDDFMTFWKICNNNFDWEHDLMELISILAKNNIGYIDWEPYVPLMFSRFLKCFQLPVCYKQPQMRDFRKLNISAISVWIVSALGGTSTAQDHLSDLMNILVSYFEPSNVGRWTKFLGKFLEELVAHFVERLHYERHKKLTWETPVPNTKKLTERDITKFVESLKFGTLRAMFSSMRSAVRVSLQYLAMLRPHLIIPDVIEDFYFHIGGTFGSLNFRSAIQCLTAVLRPMLEGSCGYKEGPSYVVPLLMAALPGIDPSDTEKSVDTFDFVSTMATLVPIMDCSQASKFYDNLTKEEEATCLATANFVDFVLQFLDNCFMFVTSSSLESINIERETHKESLQESLILGSLWISCTSVFQQTSLKIYEVALDKLFRFATESIFETKVAGRLLATICQSFVQVNAEISLQKFLPFLSNNILTLLSSNNVLKEDSLTPELLHYLLLISEISHCPGCCILPHASLIRKVIDRSLQLTCREGFLMALRLLAGFLNSLLSIVPLEYRSVPQSFDRPLSEYLPVRDWGKLGNIDDLKLEFFVPGENERNCVKSIIDMYLPIQVEFIKSTVENASSLMDEKLEFALEIIRVLLDCRVLFPSWTDAPVHLVDSFLKDNFFYSDSQMQQIAASDKYIAICNGNMRNTLVDILTKLQYKLLMCEKPNTKSLAVLIQIWDILLTDKFNKIVYATHWLFYHCHKRFSGNKLLGSKRHVRSLLINRVLLQHELLFSRYVPPFTSTHKDIMMNLLQLSTSQYSIIRNQARSALSDAVTKFPYSHNLLTSSISESLKKDAVLEPDVFEGAIHIIMEPRHHPIVARHDWMVLHSLWPTLIRAKPEKISILALMKSVENVVERQIGTITVNLEVSDSCVEFAIKLCESVSDDILKHINQGIQTLAQRTQYNLEHYLSFIDLMVKIIENETLHSRFQCMAMTFLMSVIHPDVPYPPEAVKCITSYLIDDSIELRKIAIEAVIMILKQQKKTHKKMKLDPYTISQLAKQSGTVFPGDRPDNEWVKYRKVTLPQNIEEWHEMHFLHREYHGYYCWPSELTVYVPPHEQQGASLTSNSSVLEDKEEAMYNFFSCSKNLDQLIYFLSLEEQKGVDSFSEERYLMFKGLFRNGGYALLKMFVPYMDSLICSSQENSQRCAAEIIAASIRGAKHWPYEMITLMWELIAPMIQNALQNMNEETINDWKKCFRLASNNRDPKWNHWLFELLLNYPAQSNTFLEAGRLSCIEGILHCHLWKMSEVLTLWLSTLKLCLSHEFENVRQRVGEALSCIFEADISFPGGASPKSPHIADFIAYVLPSLSLLYKMGADSTGTELRKTQNESNLNETVSTQGHEKNTKICSHEGKKIAIRMLKTVCIWISTLVSRSEFGIAASFYELVPLICLMENDENDSELALLCSKVLGKLAQTVHEPDHISPALSAMKETSECESWKSHIICLRFLEVFIFYNMPVVRSNDKWSRVAIDIVLKLLEDNSLEVRENAAQVLCGLLHTGFIKDVSQLLNSFKVKVGMKRTTECKSTDPTYLRLHHAAILGLCSFINAHPYDIPDFVPDLFTILQKHINDSRPIPQTIRKTLSDFQRTHHDKWGQNRLKFSEEQLTIMEEIAEPLSYYT